MYGTLLDTTKLYLLFLIAIEVTPSQSVSDIPAFVLVILLVLVIRIAVGKNLEYEERSKNG